MRLVILVILVAIAIVCAADETDDEAPKLVTGDIGIEFEMCHPGDEVTIHVVPIPQNEHRREGWFKTSHALLTLGDLTMLPDGTNKFEVRTICRGQTSEVSVAFYNLQRPPPKPKIRRRSLTKTNLVLQFPPMPPGLIPALPDEASRSHAEFMQRLKNAQERGYRRSQ